MVTNGASRPSRVHEALIFKALADPTRRDILDLLRRQSMSVGDLASNFRVSRPAISKHLRVLRDAGLVRDTPQGAAVMCALNPEPLKAIDEWLSSYKRFWNRSLTRLKGHMEKQP
jgi:DNA-binding transcriptional ArsR family regulator